MDRALVVYADGPHGPLPDPALLASILGRPVEALLGWLVRPPRWLGDEHLDSFPEVGGVTTLILGAGLRRAVATGRVRPMATRVSSIPGLLAGRLRPDVAVVGAAERPAGRWRLVGGPGWALSAVRAATGVVVERWSGERDIPALGPELPECRVLAVVDRTEPPDPLPENKIEPVHRQIGRMVASLVPEGATIQWGPGALGAAVVAALDRPVRVCSGLVTDELAELDRRGLLQAPAEAAYVWGSAPLDRMTHSGRLLLREVAYTHDVGRLNRLARFVAINTALQVGLDGAVNVEVAGGHQVSGPGGHPDFAAGAAGSARGLSIVALTAVSRGRSNIVSRPAVVSTSRADVDVIVTEYGIADLRGCPDSDRAARVAALAAPEFREELVREAEMGRR